MTHDRVAASDPVLELVGRLTGLTFPAVREPELQSAVRRGMAAAHAATPAAYARRLETDARAMDALLTDLAVGETFFFREPDQLEFIRSEVLPPLTRSGRPIRAWSAGCATGEEAYTLAFLLGEAGAVSARVLGTDLSADRIARARRGRYREWSLRGMSPEVRTRYFRRRGGSYEVIAALRERVEFRTLNLRRASVGAGVMDLVLCRNVLIYLDPPTVAQVAERLLAALTPDGWLFLGASDPSLSELIECEVLVTSGGIAYRRRSQSRTAGRPRLTFGNVDRLAETENSAGIPAVRPGEAQPRRTVQPPAAAEAAVPDEDDDEVSMALASVLGLADRGRSRQAELACDEALRRWGARADLLSVKAMVLTAQGSPKAAAQAARSALYLDPELVMAHIALAEALAAADRQGAAVRAFRNAERLLDGLPADARVPAARSETAGEMMALVRMRLRLLKRRQS